MKKTVSILTVKGGIIVSKMLNVLKVSLCFALIALMAGCGTILYPQRRGQVAGKIDAGVAVMDGVGLLLFLIPGVVAFAVDFSTGAIYLPGTSRSSLDLKNPKIVRFDATHTSSEKIETIVKKETGLDIKLSRADVKVTRLSSVAEIN
jgi:hypothetical protein